jgi:hypothetical protein
VWLPCPLLEAEVELTDERRSHIALEHPDLLPGHLRELKMTLSDPDMLRRSSIDPDPLLFTRWFEGLGRGRYVVVVVRYDFKADRFWITTAYITARLTAGEIEWQRE